jgi:hypothetical protein
MMSRHRIVAGQRDYDARLTVFGTPCRTVWVIDRVWQALDGLNYAALVDERDSQHRKTLSTTALHDVKFFSPVMERRQAVGSKPRSIADAGEKNPRPSANALILRVLPGAYRMRVGAAREFPIDSPENFLDT